MEPCLQAVLGRYSTPVSVAAHSALMKQRGIACFANLKGTRAQECMINSLKITCIWCM